MENQSKLFLSCHIGAGFHSIQKKKDYCQLMSQSLRVGGMSRNRINFSRNALGDVNPCIETLTVLEDSVLTNAGIGSNLNSDTFGSVCSLVGVRNPGRAAFKLHGNCGQTGGCGAILPLILTGKGAWEYVRQNYPSIVCCTSDEDFDDYLVVEEQRKHWKRYKKIATPNTWAGDTIGVISASSKTLNCCCSSGGLAYKFPGRIGSGGIYGAGCFVGRNTSVCVSGNGEEIMRNMVAKTVVENVEVDEYDLDEAMKMAMEKACHSKSPFLCGILGVQKSNLSLSEKKDEKKKKEKDKETDDGKILFAYAHNTKSFAVGYYSSTMKDPKTIISYLPNDDWVGKKYLLSVTPVSM